MAELLQANWILVVLALVIGLLVAWWIFVASRRTKVEVEEKDETAPIAAKRNQALIDTPPAAASGASVVQPSAHNPEEDKQPVASDAQDVEAARTAASPGETSAAANADTTAAAPLGTDAETGDGVPARAAITNTPPQPPRTDSASAASSGTDDLKRIKGVGPKLVAMLHEQGVTSFAQIAGWSDADIDRIDPQLGRFQGRIRRDSWVEQAALLKDGDTAAYEAKFGRTA